jgi:RNA polymerase sigma factor (sigma-70 family)
VTDEEIIEKIINEEKSNYFEMLYDRYADKVYRKAILMVKDNDVAQDMAHDVMIKTFMKLSTFEGKSSFSTWLYQITYTHCIDYLRKQKKMVEETIDDEKFDATPWLEDSQEAIEEKELFETQLEHLHEVLDEINPQDKILLMMKYQDNMAIKDIAEFCHCGESAVKMKLKRARDKVKEIYKQKYKKV